MSPTPPSTGGSPRPTDPAPTEPTRLTPGDLPCTIVDPAAEPPAQAAPEPEGRIRRTTRRARAEQEKLTERAADTLGRLEAIRPDNSLVDAVFRTYERDTATGGVVLAGALAFRVF